MASKKPLPKSQEQLSNDSITPYLNQAVSPLPNPKRREYQRSVKEDDVKNYSTGLRDIDEAIFYYFNNVIKPSVIQNSKKIEVPVLYGSPERWAAVQKDGFYRDKNGKIQTPLIMIKRDLVEKNRTLSNKMDANNPNNFYIFEKKYSNKNHYDRFSILTNRQEVKEYQAVVVPDFVDITYSCIIFTEYVEQMNKLVESINYASDSYWGDPQKYNFRAMIDSFTTTTEVAQGQDRTIKTTFTLKLLGHIISDAINTQLQGSRKFFSKSAINFTFETAGNIETLNARAKTPDKAGTRRLFENTLTNAQQKGMTIQQISYVGTTSTAIADIVGSNSATFTGKTILTPPSGFSITQGDFQVFINGVQIPNGTRTVTQSGSDILVTFNTAELGYTLDSRDQVVIVGKFS